MPEKTISVTRAHTLETFMKTVTKLKISDDVLDDFIQGLDELAAKITKTSVKFAEEEKKNNHAPGFSKSLGRNFKNRPLERG